MDMADEAQTRKWIAYFDSIGLPTVAINSLEGKGLQSVFKAAKELLKPKWDRMKERGIKPRAIRAMIVGIPNVGKSTLINRFAKKNIAKTGNTPGVTKRQQWIKVEKEIELLPEIKRKKRQPKSLNKDCLAAFSAGVKGE